MKLSKVANQLEELPDDLRRSILSLIDTKTEYDMEQIIGKIDQIQNQAQQMESRLDSRLESQAQQMESRLEIRLESQMQQMLWFIGGAIAIVGILVPIILRLLH